MRHNWFNLTLSVLVAGSALTAQSQAPGKRLGLNAALVLTPEFCATVSKKGGEKFPVGKSACAQLESALGQVFATIKPVDDASKAGNVQVVLEPKFADVGTTQPAFAFSDRELVVLVEWTVRDQQGKIVWVDTVQGDAKRHIGNAYTHSSNLKHIVEDSVRKMAEASASKMAASPQLAKLGTAPAN